MQDTPPNAEPGLPTGLAEAVEVSAGGVLQNLRRHAGGGASREGAHVDLVRDGQRIPAFLAYDVRREGDAERSVYARRE
ncbi:MAG: hypothetical protein JWR59_1471, partial [Brevundimonas sp.]|nr:hypothetical protein [Brevundimonas sp.]